MEEAIQKEAGWRAESLQDLAQQLHVPELDFENTIKQYNEHVDKKEDPDFYKSSDYLRFSIRKGPFYALKARSTSLGTIGGIETNAKMEALKVNKQPIKGAYVAGNDASGMYDTSYPTLEGISCAFAWNSGRLAGKSVIKYLGK